MRRNSWHILPRYIVLSHQSSLGSLHIFDYSILNTWNVNQFEPVTQSKYLNSNFVMSPASLCNGTRSARTTLRSSHSVVRVQPWSRVLNSNMATTVFCQMTFLSFLTAKFCNQYHSRTDTNDFFLERCRAWKCLIINSLSFYKNIVSIEMNAHGQYHIDACQKFFCSIMWFKIIRKN